MKRKQVETKIINGVTYLKCTKCREWKELNEENFYKDKTNENIGFKSQCKECKKKYIIKITKKIEELIKRNIVINIKIIIKHMEKSIIKMVIQILKYQILKITI